MKERTFRKVISFVLTLIFAIQLVPVQALAQESDPAAKAGERFVDSRLSDSDSSVSADTAADLESAEVVCEIIESRSEFQKEFLMDNGLRLAVIYPNAVHYQEDGEWREIDNTLRPVAEPGGNLSVGEMTAVSGTGTASYRNTAGMWDVTLPANLNANSAVQVEKDGYTLNFRFAGEVNSNTVIMRVENPVEEAQTTPTEELTDSDESNTNTANINEEVSVDLTVDTVEPIENTAGAHNAAEPETSAPVAPMQEAIAPNLTVEGDNEGVVEDPDTGAAVPEIKMEKVSEEENTPVDIPDEEQEEALRAIDSAVETVTYELSVAQATSADGVIMSIPKDSPEMQWEYPEARVDTLSSAITYSGVYSNTDIRYDLTSNKLKESVIINQSSATLTGYEYVLTAPNMVLELQEDNSIHAYAADAEEGDEPIFYLPAPYLLDQEDVCSTNVGVTLRATGDGQYTLSYALPRQWLLDESRAYPVILDPVVQPVSDTTTIRDVTVRQYGSASNFAENLRVGYWEDYGAERIFIRFKYIPQLSSADVVVKAAVSMYKIKDWPTTFDVEAHQIVPTDPNVEVWDSEDITWANQPPHNPVVEDVQTVGAEGWYTWDITNIAQKWYGEAGNVGLMFRGSSTWENGNPDDFTQFYSSDVSNSNLAPVLQILYLNNSGLEDYWDYTAQSAGRAGTGYVSKFTGNLVWVHGGLGFSGSRMPVSISHVYNANDKVNNDASAGYGWRTNYHQKVYQWTTDNSYYVWIDQDGTRKYFKHDSALGKYVNEIDSTLTLTANGTGAETYCITDKSGNKSYFDASGRLTKIQNNQKTPSNITIAYDASGLLSRITDGAGRKYQFSYESGFLSEINFLGTGETSIKKLQYTYDNGNLKDIEYPDQKKVTFGYAANHLLTAVNDVDGYSINYEYNATSTDLPNRVVKITEKDGTAAGGVLNIEYAHNQTTFTDHNGNQEIVQFNNYGSTTSVQDGQGRAQFYQYSISDAEPLKTATQMTLSSKLQNTVVNLARNGGFEWEAYWTAASGNASTGSWAYNDAITYLEWEAMEITRTENNTPFAVRSTADASCPVEPGKAYTLSAYVKTTGMTGSGAGASIALQLDSSGAVVAESEAKKINSDWSRVEVTYVHPTTAAADSVAILLSNESVGTAYFDCVQLEQSTSASRLNIMENGDFRTTTTASTEPFGWRESDACGGSERRESAAFASAAPQMDNSAYSITGAVGAEKYAYQNILISGAAGDVYTLAGWAKGDSTPTDNGDRSFALGFRFYYSDGSDKDILIPFNPDCDSANSWQYAASQVVAERDYTSIRIMLLYENNMNTVYFDGIQLFKEEFGHSYVYDSSGNVISVTDLQNQKTDYEYTDNHLTAITMGTGDDKKVIAEYTYDDYNNVKKTVSAEGVTTNFTYDDYGNNTEVSVKHTEFEGWLNRTTTAITATAAYTSDYNQLAAVTDALGNTTTYNYDLQTGLLLSVRAPGETAAEATTYTYDDLYRTVGVSKGSGTAATATTYTYATDLLDTITSASGTEYNFEYGAFDLVQSVSVGSGENSRTLISHDYTTDANRYLTRSTYGNGDYIAYAYDDLGRAVSKTYEDGDTVTYAYDNDGNLGLMTDSATGRTTKYLYDFQGRVMGYDETGTNYSNAVRVEYDDKNNLSSQTHTLNGESYTTSYTYDEDNRLTSSAYGDISTAYTYDNLSRMTKVVESNSSSTVVTTDIGYKETETTSESGSFTTTNVTTSTQISTWKNRLSANSTTYTYTYDNRGNILSIAEKRGVTTTTTSYIYDDLDQLLRENNQAAGKTWVYEYDNGGNITSKTEYAYTTGEVGTPLDTITYTYGDSQWKDLLTAYDGQTITTDSIGNVTNDGVRTYTWEHGRQLVVTSSNGMPVSYAYNADGQRVSKSVAGFVTNFHYAGDQLAVMVTGNDVLEFSYDVLGPATLTYNDVVYYYLRNAQGDITGIVNSSGTQVVAYTYDAWGNILSVTGSMATTLGTLNPFRYRSYFYDTETGLYYLNSRYYNPQWGRFINADAYVATGQGLLGSNMFAYCGNNPVNRTDESGKIWNVVIGGVLGAIAGGVGAALKGENVVMGAVIGGLTGMAAGIVTILAPALNPLIAAGINALIGAAGNALNQYTNYRLQDPARRGNGQNGTTTIAGSTFSGQSQAVADRAYNATTFSDYFDENEFFSSMVSGGVFSFTASVLPDLPDLSNIPRANWVSMLAKPVMLQAENSMIQVAFDNHAILFD